MEVKSSLPLNAGTPVKMNLKTALAIAVVKYGKGLTGSHALHGDPIFDEMQVKQHVPPAPQKRKFKAQ